MESQPALGAHGDTGAVGAEGVQVFDDMDILDAEAIARAQDRGGVVGLVNVLEDEGEPAGAAGENGSEALPAMGGKHGSQLLQESGRQGRVKGGRHYRARR